MSISPEDATKIQRNMQAIMLRLGRSSQRYQKLRSASQKIVDRLGRTRYTEHPALLHDLDVILIQEEQFLAYAKSGVNAAESYMITLTNERIQAQIVTEQGGTMKKRHLDALCRDILNLLDSVKRGLDKVESRLLNTRIVIEAGGNRPVGTELIAIHRSYQEEEAAVSLLRPQKLLHRVAKSTLKIANALPKGSSAANLADYIEGISKSGALGVGMGGFATAVGGLLGGLMGGQLLTLILTFAAIGAVLGACEGAVKVARGKGFMT